MENFKKFLKKLYHSFLRASAINIIVIIILVAAITIDSNFDRDYVLLLSIISALVAIATIVFMSAENNPYKQMGYYANMSKRCFKGLNENAVNFWKGVDLFEKSYYINALEFFNDINQDKLSTEEVAYLEFLKGRCYALTACPLNAVKAYRTAIECKYENPRGDKSVFVCLSRALVQIGDHDEAVEICEKLIKDGFVPDYIYTDIGIAYLRKGDGKKALAAFKKSIDEKMNYSFALGGCALAYLLDSDFENSREYYQLAIINGVDDPEGFKEYYTEIENTVKLKNGEASIKEV